MTSRSTPATLPLSCLHLQPLPNHCTSPAADWSSPPTILPALCLSDPALPPGISQSPGGFNSLEADSLQGRIACPPPSQGAAGRCPASMLWSTPRGPCFLGTLQWSVTDAEMGESFASQSWHTTLPSNLPLPSRAEDPPRRRGPARQRPEAPQPGLPDLHRPH